jgi:hypothetical protein
LVLLALKTFAGWDVSIVDVLKFTNGIPCIFAAINLVYSGSEFPSEKKIISTLFGMLKILPRTVSATLVFNLLTNILPYALSKTLPLRDLGLFRVATSVIQAATSIFPVSSKAIFVAFVGAKSGSALCRTIMIASLLYFSILGFSAYMVTIFVPKLSQYLALVACLPVFYWAVVLERYWLAVGARRRVMFANLATSLLIVSSVFFVHELNQAMLVYATGFSAYLLVLNANSKSCIDIRIVYFVALLSPCVVWFEGLSVYIPLLYMSGLIFLAFALLRAFPAELRNLRFLK